MGKEGETLGCALRAAHPRILPGLPAPLTRLLLLPDQAEAEADVGKLRDRLVLSQLRPSVAPLGEDTQEG